MKNLLPVFRSTVTRSGLFAALLGLALLLAGPGRAQSPVPAFNLVRAAGVAQSPMDGMASNHKIATDAAGNSYIAGTFEGTVSFGSIALSSVGGSDVFVAKLDPAGNYLWAVRGGGNGSDSSQGIAVDATGHIYITGSFTSTATFGTALTTAGNSDIFVAKLTPAGTWLWATQGGGINTEMTRSLAVDGGGNAYITGFFDSSSASFGSSTLSNAGAIDAFVAKLDAAGTWLWARSVGGSSPDGGTGLAVDAAGNATLTGFFSSASATFGSVTLSNPFAGFTKVYAARLSASGTWLWASTVDGVGDALGQSVGLDASGNAYVAGYFACPQATFGSTTLTNVGQYDIFVGKLSPTGTWLWAQQAGGADEEYSGALAVDAAGNAYLTGWFSGVNTAFGPTVLGYGGRTDAFVAKLSPAGTWLWAERMGGAESEAAFGVALSPTAEPWVAGTTSSSSIVIGGVGLNNPASPFTMGFVARMGATATGTAKSRPSELSLWPNPARETVRMTLGAATSTRPLLLLDATGRVLRRQELAVGATQTTVSTAGLAPGTYLLRCGSSAQRFVVE